MSKTTINLLTGPLWLVRPEQISQLRSQYQLIDTALTSRMGLSQSQPTTPTSPRVPPPPKVTMNPSLPLEKPSQAEMPKQVTSSSKPPQSLASVGPAVAAEKLPPSKLYTDWDNLVSEAQNCSKCNLCYGRQHVVIERGNRQAAWMLIGEAPGEQEDHEGRPFVGASGQLLDKMIAAMQLDAQNQVYIANVIKCRPPHNRNPEASEISACASYLQSQIALVKPQIIITLGRFAAHSLLATDLALAKLRSQVHHYNNIPVIVTYHPSYLLRTPAAKAAAWQDLQLAMQTHKNI